jgi:hypothetical protein
VLVGSVTQVADQLEAWMDETDIDGFNLAFAVNDETFRDVIELIVPELQRRGRYRNAYSSGTLREKLFGRGARLPENHPGRRVRLQATYRLAVRCEVWGCGSFGGLGTRPTFLRKAAWIGDLESRQPETQYPCGP